MDAIESLAALAKGDFPTGKGNNVNDSTDTAPRGAKKMAPVGAKPAPPGNAGQDEPPDVAKPGEGKPGAMATPGEDPDKGSVQYATKVKNPETGEFEFAYQADGERDEDARFVVSDETGEGAHWELPQDSEHYAAFKQWKSAKKQGLTGTQIPKELVDGAVKHAERHHFDGGPHKAAYDDHMAHQGEGDGPAAPPTHHSMKNGGGSHPAMQGQPPGNSKDVEADVKPGSDGDPPKKDMIGKLAQFAKPHMPRGQEPKTTGTSRNGMEYPATGATIAEKVAGYESIYGLRRSAGGDPISALGVLTGRSVPEASDLDKAEPGNALSDLGGYVQQGDSYQLRKGLDTYDLSHLQEVPKIETRLLYSYLAGFIAAAYEHEQREPEHRLPMAGEDMYERIAQPVFNKVVAYVPRNQHLARAVKEFSVTIATVAEIMKQRGMVKPRSDGSEPHGDKWSDDRDSAAAMGVNHVPGPERESLVASMQPDPLATRNLTLSKGPKMVTFESTPMDMRGAVRRASLDRIQFKPEQNVLVKANYNPQCIQHGDIHKQQIGHQSNTHCSCPR
ncbi:MAG: hypothetical protein O7G84_19375 [Gammaproteobacteria bacterium]|nr:hypothetical protein [Gammaproteobacteria bacterium]